MMLCAAIIIDFIPEAQTLFTVVVGVVIGNPEITNKHFMSMTCTFNP